MVQGQFDEKSESSEAAQAPNTLAELRPRGVWDILDDAFDLYRQRFSLFAGIAAVVYVPAYTLSIVVTAINLPRLASRSSADPFSAFSSLLGIFVYTLPVLMVAYILQNGATSVAVENTLLGRAVTIVSAYKKSLQRFFPLLLVAILVGLMEFGGLCFLAFPALIFAALFAFVAQVVVLEKRGAIPAMLRSRELCNSAFGNTLGLLLLVALLTGTISNGVSGLLQLISLAIPGVATDTVRQTQQSIINQSVVSVVSLLLAPIFGIATTLLYYDLRVRREGLDLIAQAEIIQYPLAPDPFGGVSRPKSA